MRQRKFVMLFAVVSFATLLVVPGAGPTGADVVDGCSTGMYPNTPASASQLKITCTFTHATAAAGNVLRIEDFPDAQWHAGAARVTHADGHVTLNSGVVTSATGHFRSADVNRGISGTGIKPGSFIKVVTGTTKVTMSQTASATATTSVLTINYSRTRKVADATTTAASTVVTSATANFKATDIGDPVHSTNIPHGAFITILNSATSVKLNMPATASGTHQGVVVSDPHTGGASFQVHDGHTTLGSKTISSVMGASFLSDPLNLGLAVKDSSIGNANLFLPHAAGEPIPGVDVSLEQIPGGISVQGTRTTTGSVFTFGRPSYDAPKNGETVAYFNIQRALNPALVTGSPSCSAAVVTASTVPGTWHNPGSFVGGSGVASSEAAAINGPILGQITFTTPVLSFVAYVVQLKANTAGESDASAHDDIVFPSFPAAVGMCPAPSTVGVSESFQFVGATASQTTSGNGSVRALKDFPVGTATTTGSAYVHLLQNTTPVFETSTDCTENYPGTPAFDCGTG